MVQVEIAMPNEACVVKGDLGHFETAIINMLVNSCDAMNHAGRLSLAVTSGSNIPEYRCQAATAGRFVVDSVTDTGIGIPANKINDTFEPSYTTKDVGRGTGLGLAQVLGFAKKSGGGVRVLSKIGEGSTFTLYLPKAEEPDGRAR